MLGGDYPSAAVAVDRAAFENPVANADRQPRILCKFGADGLVAGHLIFAAPAVEAEALGAALAGLIADHQRPGVAQPDIAVNPLLQRDPRRDELARPRRIGIVAQDQPHLLAAVRHRAGKGGDLALRLAKGARPFLGSMGKADPQPLLWMPFGGQGESGTV